MKSRNNIDKVVSDNPRMVIYVIMILFGLLTGYMSEAENNGEISGVAVIIASVLVFPASIGVFYELYKKVKSKVR